MYRSAPCSPRYRMAIARWLAWLAGPEIAAGPDAVTYMYGHVSLCVHTLSHLATSTARALRDSRPVIRITWPPGWYPYQIGTVSGAPSSTTLTTPTCGWARNCSRSARLIA